MRAKTLLFVTALLAGWVSAAGAQQATDQQATGQQPTAQQATGQQATGQQTGETTTVSPWQLNMENWLDAGVRITGTTGDRARFERYQDPRSGPFLYRFRYEKEHGPGIFSVALDNVGYRDQRLAGQYIVPGKMHVSVEWDQIPTFWTLDAHTPYNNAGSAVQTLPPGLAQSVQSGANFANTYNALSLAPYDIMSGRHTLAVNFLYNATKDVDLNLNVRTYSKSGSEPWAMSSGFAGTADVEAPVDTRTTDLTAGAEWTNDKGLLRVAYDGSWFSNHQESLTIDNPLRATSTTTASQVGRSALWPSNSSNTVTAAGALNSLPGHSRLNAAFAIGSWSNDTTLLPMTINPAIPPVVLPRSTAEGDIRRTTTTISFVTRPATYLHVDARYRLYDFDDRTPEFIMGAGQPLVEYDAQIEAQSEELVPAHFSHRQNAFEAVATITKLREVSFSGGYRLNHVSYTDREVGSTTDNGLFVSADSRPFGMVSFHGSYEHSRRRAADFNSLALEDLPDSGEYPGLRRYDIADRDRDAGTVMAQVMPSSMFAVSGTVTIGRDNFPNEQFTSQDAFGLQYRKTQNYAIFFDATPNDKVIVSAGYGYQNYKSDQQSRQVSVAPTTPPSGQQLDPKRDWTVTEDETVHFAQANVELTNMLPKTAIRFTWDFNKANSPYVYGLAPGSPLTAGVPPTPGAPPVQLPPITNRWHDARIDVRYFLRKNLAAGVMYWLERYRVDDTWSMGSTIEHNNALPGILLLGYGFRDYTANSVWLRVMYIF